MTEVVGLGGVGISTLLANLSFRAEGVIAVDTNDGRLDYALSFGVELVVNPRQSPLVDQLTKPTSDMLDHVLESSGNARSLEH